MILFIFVAVLTGVAADTDSPEAVCPTPVIKAHEGEGVLLRCHVTPPTDLSALTVDWKRADSSQVVYSYRHRQENHQDQAEQYRNRTRLNLDGLKTGNVTLWISPLHLSDSGSYTCFVPKWWISCSLTLTVVSKNQQNGTKMENVTTTKTPLVKPTGPEGKTLHSLTAVLAVVVLPLLVLFLVGLLIWIRQKKIKKCWRLRGEMQEIEMTNVPEETSLRHDEE